MSPVDTRTDPEGLAITQHRTAWSGNSRGRTVSRMSAFPDTDVLILRGTRRHLFRVAGSTLASIFAGPLPHPVSHS